MIANEKKTEQKQEGGKHKLTVFMIMILLPIVSLSGVILFSREDFKDGAKEYLAVKYLENKEKLMFKNKDRDKYCSYKLDKNGNIKVKVKFDKLYKDEYTNRIDLCVKFKPNSDRYKMALTDYPGKFILTIQCLQKQMNFISRFMESIIIQPSRKNSKRVHIPLM